MEQCQGPWKWRLSQVDVEAGRAFNWWHCEVRHPNLTDSSTHYKNTVCPNTTAVTYHPNGVGCPLGALIRSTRLVLGGQLQACGCPKRSGTIIPTGRSTTCTIPIRMHSELGAAKPAGGHNPPESQMQGSSLQGPGPCRLGYAGRMIVLERKLIPVLRREPHVHFGVWRAMIRVSAAPACAHPART